MTQKSPDFCQKVWLLAEREIVAGNGCCFSVWSQTMSSLLHKREGFGGKVREGAAQPPGERKSGEGCSFRRGTEGRKTFLLM